MFSLPFPPSPARCRRALLCLFLFYQSLSASATLTNRTIDDEYGDEVTGLVPGYSPAAAWKQGSTCTSCYIHADTNQAYRGTWHDSTHTPGDAEPRIISLSFNGTAIYAYCILANTVQYTTTLTNLTFRLDGQGVGKNFVHVPTTSTDFQYNVPVYANESIANGQHLLEIEATGDTNSSLVLFDYATYTFDSDPVVSTTSSQSSQPTASSPPPSETRSSKHSNIGAIVGGVVGGVLGLSLLVLGIFLYSRRRPFGVDGISRRRNREKVDLAESDDGSGASNGRTLGTFTPYTAVNNESSSDAVTQPFLLRDAASTSTRVPGSDYGYGVGTGHNEAPTLPTEAASAVAVAATTAAGHSSRAPRSKAAMREEELSRQIREREQHVADLQRRRTLTSHSPSASQSTGPASSIAPPSSVSAGADSEMRTQIEALQQEVERLRAEQRQMLWEMDNAPPPEYEERRLGT